MIVSLPAGYGDLTLFQEDIDKVLEGVKKHPKFTADVVVAISKAVATQEKHDAAWAALGANLREVFDNDKIAFLASEDIITAIILNALSKPRRDAYTDKVPPKKKNVADPADIGIRREARRKAQLYVNQVFTRLKNYVFPPVQLEGNAADRKAKKGACATAPLAHHAHIHALIHSRQPLSTEAAERNAAEMKEEAAPAAGGGGGGGGPGLRFGSGGADDAPREPASKRRLSEMSTLSSLYGEEDEEGGGAALPAFEGDLSHLMASVELAGAPVPAPLMPVKELRALAAEVKERAFKLAAKPAATEDDGYVIISKEIYEEGKELEKACLRF